MSRRALALALVPLLLGACSGRSPAPEEPATPPPVPVLSDEVPAELPDLLIVVLDTTGPHVVQREMPCQP